MSVPSALRKFRRKIRSVAERFRGTYESDIESLVERHPSSGGRSRPLRILYVARKYTQGDRRLGFSFEENNFFNTLQHMGHDLIRVPYPRSAAEGKVTSEILGDLVLRYSPDLLFCVLIKDELDLTVIRQIGREGRTATVNWFCDDDWRFDSFSRKWGPNFNWVVTNSPAAVAKYQAIGQENALYLQWACNHFMYRRLPARFCHDVTFVGDAHGRRAAAIARLARHGLHIETWGRGWSNGPLPQARMIRLFGESRINLVLSWSSDGTVVEVKARDFEIPGCGGFLLTGAPEPLISVDFEAGKEIVTYSDLEELAEKARFFLAHDDERRAIAGRGYARVLADHTYEQRFSTLFREMGL